MQHIGFGFLFVFLACSSLFGQETDTTQVVLPDYPIMFIENPKVDIGEINQFDNSTVVFNVVNNGGQPLKISEVKGNCGCKKIEFTKTEIQPKKFGLITVKYDTKRVGEFEEELKVVSNAKEMNTSAVHISGYVNQKASPE